jgi:hypothetical protein
MTTMARRPFQSFGPRPSYHPGGEFYKQLADSVLEKIDPALKALLDAFGGCSQTDITRRTYIGLLPEELQGISLRTVTNWWKRFIDFGWIVRKREQFSNVWTMTWNFPPLYGNEGRPSAAVPNPGTATPKVANVAAPAPVSEPQVDVEMGEWAVEFSERYGWRLIVDDKGQPQRSPIPGMDQRELPPGHIAYVAARLVPAVLAYLKDHPLRE